MFSLSAKATTATVVLKQDPGWFVATCGEPTGAEGRARLLLGSGREARVLTERVDPKPGYLSGKELGHINRIVRSAFDLVRRTSGRLFAGRSASSRSEERRVGQLCSY